MHLKDSKGVTLVALAVTVIVLLIITGTIIYNTKSDIKLQKVNKLYQDIENINQKIDDYYLKYGDIPTIGDSYCDKTELEKLLKNKAESSNATLVKTNNSDNIINPNDGDEYYVIDLEKLDGLTLNYGYEDNYKKIKANSTTVSTDKTDKTDIYIINKVSHQVYYPEGIIADNYMYYCYDLNTNMINISDINIPVNYDYTGKAETRTLSAGTYKLQVWGAQGGDAIDSDRENLRR
ncbi:MAG: hypothetical protein HFJ17_01885 [Clostridia bacterium]|nr:hypothetical protein [Clostridia bacterium]